MIRKMRIGIFGRIVLAVLGGSAMPLVCLAEAVWLSVPEAPVCEEVIQDGFRAADGTSWFAASRRNAAEVRSAKWTVSGLGVFDVYVNGRRVGDDFLKPGFTH